MDKAPKQEILKNVTVSKEIKEALSAEWLIEGEDVRLPDYVKMKTELRDILTPVGIWSADFDLWIDKNINKVSLLGKTIDEIGKWMERKNNPHRKEELARLRSFAKRDLEQAGAWLSALEVWLENGSPKDLQKVGENMDYMGRAYSTISTLSFMKDIHKEKPE